MKMVRQFKRLGLIIFACSFIATPLMADGSEKNEEAAGSEKIYHSVNKKSFAQRIAEIEEAGVNFEHGEAFIKEKGYEEEQEIPDQAYPGLFHYWAECPTDWSWFMLEDESVWYICYEDRQKVQNWFRSYPLVLRPNNYWWDSNKYYKYQIYNTVTNEVVQVNMDRGPLVNGPYTRVIHRFLNHNHEIQLDDGSVWQVKARDRKNLRSWIQGQSIHVGLNNDWFIGQYQYILINHDTGDWVRVHWKY